MKTIRSFLVIIVAVLISLSPLSVRSTEAVPTAQSHSATRNVNLNPNPPSSPVKLTFIHHSCGANWLGDSNGQLATTLMANNYYVSDAGYGWRETGNSDGYVIGDNTDIGHWWLWFRGPNSPAYTQSLYARMDNREGYTRMLTEPNPGSPNEVIMFKSCYPNSDMYGNINDPVPPIASNPLKGQSSPLTVANAKGIYIDLLEYFQTRQDKLFIVITAPPMQNLNDASKARAFNNWLVNDWLTNYPYKNVRVFDFYNVMTSNGGNPTTNDLGAATGNHHRYYNNAIQHKTDGGGNILAYPTSGGDDHPT